MFMSQNMLLTPAQTSSQVLELLIRKIIGCRISEAEANAEITAVTVYPDA